MSLQLHSITDPRDRLSKARRMELYKFAQSKGVKEVDRKDMPARLMRRILREKGFTDIPIPPRVLGQPEPRARAELMNSNGQPLNQPKGIEVDADADMLRQYQAEQARAAAEKQTLDVGSMTRAQLAKACKERGIKFGRTAKKEELAEKLRGQNAA